MKIGCPKEIKDHEYRVGLTPSAVREYVQKGHQVCMEQGAGRGSGLSDEEYQKAGADICQEAEDVWFSSDMIVKVKEPLPREFGYMKYGQILYTYFHFAADETLTRECLEKGIIAIAYETVQEDDGTLPLLLPMSEIAGSMAPLMGSFYLSRPNNGSGLLPTGVPGVFPARILVIGGGTVGRNATRVAAGLGADVTVLDTSKEILIAIRDVMPANVNTLFSNAHNIEKAIRDADMVIGAVLIPGAKAPKLVTKELLSLMKPGSVLVDVAIDQGGCAETSRPTTHSDPVYTEYDVVHYCVANMPGAYSMTSTFALNNATLPYGLEIAGKGVERACEDNPAVRHGLNMYKGALTYKNVAETHHLAGDFIPAESIYEKMGKAV